MDVTPDQLRAARSLLGMPRAELAGRAHVSIVTIRRLEQAGAEVQVASAVRDGVRSALEEAGAEFIPDGVRRRSGAAQDVERLYEDLLAISLRSAARLQGRETMTDADLYDEHGVPA